MVCVCVCTVVLEMWQRGPFFWRCGYECVFSVHSSHSFWNPANNSGFAVYIFQRVDDFWKVCVLCVRTCVWKSEKCAFGPCDSVSLIAIIVVFVITAEGRETPQTDSIREKYLGTCVHPHLEKKTKRGGRKEKNMTVNVCKIILITLK